ncbi:MAG: hypothetical protein AAGA67_03140, partial [Cyanobacteria bacterium P01_F01_bin.153]
MTQLLSLARQGNAEAIAAVMSRPLHKDGVSVQVNRDRSEGLVIAFLGILAPDQRQILGYVKRGLDKLGLSQVEPQVTVEGWAMGDSEPDWRVTMPLAAPGALPTADDLDEAKAPKTTVKRAPKGEPTREPAGDGGAIAKTNPPQPAAQSSAPPPKPVQPPLPNNFLQLRKVHLWLG